MCVCVCVCVCVRKRESLVMLTTIIRLHRRLRCRRSVAAAVEEEKGEIEAAEKICDAQSMMCKCERRSTCTYQCLCTVCLHYHS